MLRVIHIAAFENNTTSQVFHKKKKHGPRKLTEQVFLPASFFYLFLSPSLFVCLCSLQTIDQFAQLAKLLPRSMAFAFGHLAVGINTHDLAKHMAKSLYETGNPVETWTMGFEALLR
ncbi:MAG UNVERIFIED_CONTAM: hypothetical protein LVR29_05240 [Microcystis novacekii LVE1205-3]